MAEFFSLVTLIALSLTLYCIAARVALDLPYPACFPALLAAVVIGAAAAAGIEIAAVIARHKKGIRIGVISAEEIRRILEGKQHG